MLLTTSAFADDIYYCRGGLVGVGDWAQSTLYPLTKGEDGIYSGEVDMVARTEMTPNQTLGWGNRVDLLFDKNALLRNRRGTIHHSRPYGMAYIEGW